MARSPKLSGTSAIAHWYGYYAGYSAGFVRDVLLDINLSEDATVLDPWNGAGTTTDVAASMGLRSTGFDLNPVMVLVARARLLDSSVSGSLAALTEEILESVSYQVEHSEADPLSAWMVPSSCVHVRGIEQGIQRVLVDHSTYAPLIHSARFDGISGLAAFFYVALFDIVKVMLRRFRATNPAWIKFPESAHGRVRPSARVIEQEFRAAVERLTLQVAAKSDGGMRATGTILHGNAKKLPLRDASVDAVLTSPPYCTRIDYVITTLPELAVMGYTPRGDEVQALRREMLGTPTMETQRPRGDLPREAAKVLKKIKAHRSISSATYYHRCFEQYFSQLHSSLCELRRVVKPKGVCGVVVQDSYYKDLHVDLAKVTADLASDSGFELEQQHDFPVRRTKAAMNPRARVYRDRFDATESLLLLRPA